MIQDTGYKIQDTRYMIQDTGYKIQDTRYKIQDTVQDTSYCSCILYVVTKERKNIWMYVYCRVKTESGVDNFLLFI